MAVTIADVLQLARASGPVERAQFTQLLVNYATQGDLGDQSLATLLQCVFAVQARLTGPTARLESPKRDNFFAHLRDRMPRVGAGRALVVMFAVECAGQTLDQAIIGIMTDIIHHPAGQADGAVFAQRLMSAIGLKLNLAVPLLQRLAEMLTTQAKDMAAILAGLTFLGFKGSEPADRRAPIFQYVVLPLLQQLASADAADAALILEQVIYNDHIKALERPGHHRDVFAAIAGSMRKLGADQAAKLPALPAPPGNSRPQVAFVLHNGHRLAHVEVLLSFLAGLDRCPDKPIDPVIFLLAEPGAPELAAACSKFKVEVIVARATDTLPMTVRFQQCRQQLAELGVAATVYVSVPLHLEYLSAFRLAPVSIWWSMKFPLPNFPLLDGRVFYRLLFAGRVEIEGCTWRGGPLGLDFPAAPDADAVARIRAQYAGGPILGTVAREEKIREPAYLDAVVRIMKAHPTASFLWTGRQPLAEITQAFVANGIAERCHFIGWVDAALYCRVFDVFLETFPLTGLMSGWAMAAGQAVATAGPLGWLGTYLAGIYDGSIPCQAQDRERLDLVFAGVAGRVPCIWAKDADEFVALTASLLADPALRRDFGLSCQRFMQEFLADGAGSALTQARFFAEIVRAAAGPA